MRIFHEGIYELFIYLEKNLEQNVESHLVFCKENLEVHLNEFLVF